MSLTGLLRKISRQCSGKVRHPNRGKAEAAARALQKLDGRPVDVYICHCGTYHIGHRKEAK